MSIALPLVRERASLGVAIGVAFRPLQHFAFVSVRRWFVQRNLAAVSVCPILPLIRVRRLLGIAVGDAFVPIYRLFSMGTGFGPPLLRWFRIFATILRKRWAWGVAVPLPRWFRIFAPFLRLRWASGSTVRFRGGFAFSPILRLRWVSGLTVPLSRWFRVFYPALRLRWVSGLTVPLSRWLRVLPFWCIRCFLSFIWAKG